MIVAGICCYILPGCKNKPGTATAAEAVAADKGAGQSGVQDDASQKNALQNTCSFQTH